MNIKCNLKELINGLNIVSKTSITRTTMPILEGVLIEAEDNKLKLTTNDLEIGRLTTEIFLKVKMLFLFMLRVYKIS